MTTGHPALSDLQRRIREELTDEAQQPVRGADDLAARLGAPFDALYPELNGMHRMGLVTVVDIRTTTAGVVAYYSLTPSGRERPGVDPPRIKAPKPKVAKPKVAKPKFRQPEAPPQRSTPSWATVLQQDSTVKDVLLLTDMMRRMVTVMSDQPRVLHSTVDLARFLDASRFDVYVTAELLRKKGYIAIGELTAKSDHETVVRYVLTPRGHDAVTVLNIVAHPPELRNRLVATVGEISAQADGMTGLQFDDQVGIAIGMILRSEPDHPHRAISLAPRVNLTPRVVRGHLQRMQGAGWITLTTRPRTPSGESPQGAGPRTLYAALTASGRREIDAMSTSPRRINTGNALRAIRQRMGLTLRDVEQMSNSRWKERELSRYENGARKIGAQRLADLSEFYNELARDLQSRTATTSLSEPIIRIGIILRDEPDGQHWVGSLASQLDLSGSIVESRLRRMRAAGWVAPATAPRAMESAPRRQRGRPRNYVALTEQGRAELAALHAPEQDRHSTPPEVETP